MAHCQTLSVSGLLGALMLLALRISSSPCFSPSDMSSPGAMIFDLIDLNDDCYIHPTEVHHARAMFGGDATAASAIESLQACVDSRGASFECIERVTAPLCCAAGDRCESDADCDEAIGQRCVTCQLSSPQTGLRTCETPRALQSDCPLLYRIVNVSCYEPCS